MDLRQDSQDVHRQFKRSNRFHQVDGDWYFKTRENMQIGPWITQLEAEYEFMQYLDSVRLENTIKGTNVRIF